jgi:hypothetical protein
MPPPLQRIAQNWSNILKMCRQINIFNVITKTTLYSTEIQKRENASLIPFFYIYEVWRMQSILNNLDPGQTKAEPSSSKLNPKNLSSFLYSNLSIICFTNTKNCRYGSAALPLLACWFLSLPRLWEKNRYFTYTCYIYLCCESRFIESGYNPSFIRSSVVYNFFKSFVGLPSTTTVLY